MYEKAHSWTVKWTKEICPFSSACIRGLQRSTMLGGSFDLSDNETAPEANTMAS
jgi:hypothetical protein